jgi:hypothetical protein
MQEQQNIDLIKKLYALKADEFIAQGDKVIMVGSYGATVNATGKRFDLPLVHVWTIRNGKVERFLNFTDSAKVAEAYSVESAFARESQLQPKPFSAILTGEDAHPTSRRGRPSPALPFKLVQPYRFLSRATG